MTKSHRPIRMTFTDGQRVINALKGSDDLKMEIPDGKAHLSFNKDGNHWQLEGFNTIVQITAEQAKQIADDACMEDSE